MSGSFMHAIGVVRWKGALILSRLHATGWIRGVGLARRHRGQPHRHRARTSTSRSGRDDGIAAFTLASSALEAERQPEALSQGLVGESLLDSHRKITARQRCRTS